MTSPPHPRTGNPPHAAARHGLRLVTAAALVATLLAGCGARTSVTSRWEEPRPAAIPFGHVLVVGVSENSRLRRSFEEALAAKLGAGGTRSTASVRAGNPTQPLDRDLVVAMVGSTGADAVLVTRLTSRKARLEEGETRVGVKTQQVSSLADGPGLVELFSQSYQEYEEPGELTARSKAILESTLYQAVDGGRLVYTVVTKAEFEEGKDDVVDAVSTAIVRQLKTDGLVR